MLSPNADAQLRRVFPGDTEMARRLRAFDWSSNELGPPESWPEALRTAVAICVTSRFPMNVWWGPNLTLFYNDAYIKFLGLKKHPSALAQSGRQAWAEVWDQIQPMIDRVFATGEASWSEDIPMFFDRHVPKEEVFVTFSFSPIYGANGTVDGMFCACTETTQNVIGRRRLETLRKLGATQDRRTVQETCEAIAGVLGDNAEDIPCAAVYLCRGESLQAAAQVRLETTDRVAATLEGACREVTTTTEIAIDLGARHWPESVTRVVAVPFRSTNGPRVAVLVCGVSPRRPLDDAYRTFFELVGSHAGAALTRAHSTEDERHRLDSLAELDRVKTQFFANISHEMRTPLTLLLGPTEELLAHADNIPADVVEPLELIQRNALRLDKLVNNLLDYSRIEAGRTEMEFHPVELGRLTADVASTFGSMVEEGGLRLQIESESIRERVYVDPQAWEKIVLNLLSNAYKHTFDGSITVSIKGIGDHVQLEVRDTGVGIDEANLPHVFEQFHRVEGQRSRSYEGSGIGLALVEELVTLHGGTIEVTSEVGKGTTFTVMIPFGRAHLVDRQVHDVEAAPRSSETSAAFVNEAMAWSMASSFERRGEDHGQPRVLVVEDNADMRAYVTRILEHDCVVESVSNGLAALDAIRKSAPDLVVSDVMMPGIDGTQLVRELRQDSTTRHLPVILLSARAGEEARIGGLDAGADDYIVKPFSARELRSRIRTQLELAAARLQAGNARAAAQAKDDFLSLFGHELRNPLSAVFTSVQVLQRRAPSPEVELMDRSIRHLARLVDDLLDLSRLSRGRIPLHRRKIELSQILDMTTERIQSQLAERQTQLFVSVPRAGLVLDCDPERISQVLANVLCNASKYSEPGASVTVSAERKGAKIRIVIRDEGAGISPAQLAHVFDAFQNRNEGGGLGLGLAIARNLVELHTGSIELHSEGAGRGTECVIELPLEAAQVMPATRTPDAEKKPRKRVLLVEDNHDTAIALQRALEALGYKVALAHNGPVALTVARSFQPDVALLDIGLPVMDGWELANRLRELRVPSRKLHFVAVTARDQDSDKQRSTDAGFAEHLVKPIDLVKLERVVESLPDLPT